LHLFLRADIISIGLYGRGIMLNLNKYRWTYSAVEKVGETTMAMPKPPKPGAAPSMPKIPGMPKPPAGAKPPGGAQPPKPPQGQQAGQKDQPRGYKVGTVRRWRSGPHIKLEEGWFPYDRDKGQYQNDDGEWKDIPTDKKYHSADFPPSDTLDHAIHSLNKSFENPEDSKAVDHSIHIADHFIQLGDGMVTHKVERLKKLSEDALSGKKEKVIGLIEDMKSGDKDKVKDASEKLMEMLSDDKTREALNQIHKYEDRKDREHPIGEGKYVHTSKKGSTSGMVKKAEGFSVIPGRSVSLTMIRKSEDGTEGVFKFSALAVEEFRANLSPHVSTAHREVAAYEVDQVLGLNLVPETVLFKEYLPDEDVLEKAAQKAKVSTGEDPEKYLDKFKRDEMYEASSQYKVPDAVFMDEIYDKDIPTQGVAKHFPEKLKNSLCDMAVFDYITGATDRHLGNILITKDKDGDAVVKAIDHGFCFPNSGEEKKYTPEALAPATFHSYAAHMAEGIDIPKNTMEKLNTIDENKFKDSMKIHGLDREAEDAWARLKDIREYGKIPPPHKYLKNH
jgi:hypothetical protein